MSDTNNNLIDDKVERKINTEKLVEDLKNNQVKWRVRRRLAIVGFSFNLIIGFLYFIAVLFIKSDQGVMLSNFNSVIITIIGANFSIVGIYIGAVTYSDTLNAKLGGPQSNESN